MFRACCFQALEDQLFIMKKLPIVFLKKILLITLSFVSITTLNAQITFEEIQLNEDTIWNGSDQSGGFSTENYFFPNTYLEDPNYGGFWSSGWAVSGTRDSGTSGFTNLYSAKPGSGFDQSMQYAVGQQNALIHLGNNPGNIVFGGFYITNGTYAHNSMRDGDGFAKKFGGETGDDPDFFKLTIQAYTQGELTTDSVEFYLADYRFEDNSQDYIVDSWEYVDVSGLMAMDSLVFSLSSSDVGDYGINTPLFFCLDNLEPTFIFNTQNLNREASNYHLFPNPTSDHIAINRLDNLSFDTQISILDVSGQVVEKYAFFQANFKLNVSNLEAGVYFIQLKTNDFVATKKMLKH